jgi:hypothetical protein
VAWTTLALAAACDSQPPQPDPQPVVTASASVANAGPPSSAARPPMDDEEGGGRKRGERRVIAPVYVDGKMVAALQYGELPSKFKPTIVERVREYSLCNLADYLVALGVDLAKVRAVHLAGASRTAAIDGDELRRVKDKLHFTFSRKRGTQGKPMMDWPGTKVVATTRIDIVFSLQVFVEKEAPVWDRTKRKFLWQDGSEVVGVPYVENAQPLKAPRLYVDDQLVGLIEEGGLPPEVTRAGDSKGGGKGEKGGEHGRGDGKMMGKGAGSGTGEGRGGGKGQGGGLRVLLAKYLAHRGVALDKVKAIDFIGGDRLLWRLDGAGLGKRGDDLTFGVPKRGGKQLRMDVPAFDGSEARTLNVQAIIVYTKTTPPERKSETAPTTPANQKN